MRVRTFHPTESGDAEGEIVQYFNSLLTCFGILLDSGQKVVRHRDRITPFDDEARSALDSKISLIRIDVNQNSEGAR